MGILSLILAIVAFLLAFILPGLGIVIGIVSVVFGIIDLIRRFKKKESKVIQIIAVVIATISIFASIIFGMIKLFMYMDKSGVINKIESEITTNNSKKMIGTWYDSKNGQTLIINSDNTVELYTADRSKLYIKGTYTMTQDTTNTIGDEYFITITTTDRTVNGKKYTDKYTTKFSLTTEDYKNMVMMNQVSYNMYQFYKIK